MIPPVFVISKKSGCMPRSLQLCVIQKTVKMRMHIKLAQRLFTQEINKLKAFVAQRARAAHAIYKCGGITAPALFESRMH